MAPAPVNLSPSQGLVHELLRERSQGRTAMHSPQAHGEAPYGPALDEDVYSEGSSQGYGQGHREYDQEDQYSHYGEEVVSVSGHLELAPAHSLS